MDTFTLHFTIALLVGCLLVLCTYAIKLHDKRKIKDLYDRRCIDQYKANTERMMAEYRIMLLEEASEDPN